MEFIFKQLHTMYPPFVVTKNKFPLDGSTKTFTFP